MRITLEGVDKFGNILGSVRYPEGAGEAIDLALQLAQNGLAKVSLTLQAFKLGGPRC